MSLGEVAHLAQGESASDSDVSNEDYESIAKMNFVMSILNIDGSDLFIIRENKNKRVAFKNMGEVQYNVVMFWLWTESHQDQGDEQRVYTASSP